MTERESQYLFWKILIGVRHILIYQTHYISFLKANQGNVFYIIKTHGGTWWYAKLAGWINRKTTPLARYEKRDLILVATTQSRALISALLRSSVSHGSDSHLGCHSTPLPFKSRFQSHTNTKDIFDVLAYEFEPIQKMKSLLTQGWNQLKLMKSSALSQMKLNPPIRRRGGFHPTQLDFIVEDDFTHPQGWI